MKHRYGKPRMQSAEITKMQCNPLYTGIEVHHFLTEEGPSSNYDRTLFLDIAHRKARACGSEQCVREFMKALREPNEWTMLIPIHPSASVKRPVIVSEEDFIQGAVILISRLGIGGYFTKVIENLSQGVIPYGYQEAK